MKLLISIIDTLGSHTEKESLAKKIEAQFDWVKVIFISPNQNSAHNLQLPEYSLLGFYYKLAYGFAIKRNFDWVIAIDLGCVEQLLSLIDSLKTSFQNNKVIYLQREGIEVAKKKQLKLFNNYIPDFYSPFRFFSLYWLRQIPFIFNTDSHFQDEINIQLFYSKQAFTLIPIANLDKKQEKDLHFSTRKVFRQAKYHSWGIFYQKKFDCVIDNQHYSLKLGYKSSHTLAIDAVAPDSTVLDIGAGPYSTAPFLHKKNCKVTTLDMFDIPEEFKLTEHIVANLNDQFDVDISQYQYLLFLDIIEHLYSPEDFLQKLSEQFGHQKQKLIFTTGNIAFFPLRLMLLLGYFNYGKSGILDKTHTRLFTFKSFKELLEASHLKVIAVKGIPAPYPKALGNNTFSRFLVKLNSFLIKLSKGLFSYQIYIEAETTTTISYLIATYENKH
jgi:2-polyprenyl-3-methyl-5-hydroxy-6-metoxy-1,4-benzoquinol methylase